MYWISKLATRTDEKHFGGWVDRLAYPERRLKR